MARRMLVLLALAAAVAACSNEGSPTVPSRSTSTTAAATTSSSTGNTVAGGSSTTTTFRPSSSTTPTGAGIPMQGATGSGTVTWSVDTARVEFCYRITISGAGNATSAKLKHVDGGDEVLTLVAPGVNGTVNTCSPTDQITVQQLQSTPSAFFVEVVAAKGTLRATLR